jgi:hypothetical protein
LDHPPPIYAKSTAGAECSLAQGEFISNLVQAHIELSTLGTTSLRIADKTHPYGVILSQGCELEQDYYARQELSELATDKLIPTVLFCEVITAAELRSKIKKSEFWNRIQKNNDERYHFFQAIGVTFDVEGEGLPELGVDFKRFFSIPTDEVYHRIRLGEAKRRCCLQSPYLEHFCRRFANFLSRIALPAPHSSE